MNEQHGINVNILGKDKMSKHRREGDLSGRDVGLIGERREKVSGYDIPMWEAVNRMVEGHVPTTNLATIASAAKHGSHNDHMYKKGGHVGHRRSVEHEQRQMVEGEREHMRENDNPRHKKHHEHHKKHHRKHFAAGGVGKVRKDQY